MDDQQPFEIWKRRAFLVGTDTSTLVEICHQHGTQGKKKKKNQTETTLAKLALYASGFVVDTSSTNPSIFETELQHNYTDLTGQLNVTTAVALANNQRPPARHVSSLHTFSSVTHCSYI